MTENDAKEKWCPMVRLGAFSEKENAEAVGGINRFLAPKNSVQRLFSNCIASNCMMWRWNIPSNNDPLEEIAAKQGYCGLSR